jgi:hypothetical protein
MGDSFMLRKCLFFCALLITAFACSRKKTPETVAETTNNPPLNSTPLPKKDSLPVPEFVTLKLKGDVLGIKRFVTEVHNGTLTMTLNGKPDSKKSYSRNEYTEEILALTKGELYPTKFIRSYKIAERTTGVKPSMAASYSGKTVLFEKTFGLYSVLVDKNSLPVEEDQEFRDLLEKSGRNVYSTWLPPNPIRINAPWQLGQSAFEQFSIGMGLGIDKSKSKNSGVLTKLYYKGKTLWGVLEFNFNIVIEGNVRDSGLVASGTDNQTVILDMVVDGSSNEGVVKRKNNGKWEMAGKGLAFTIIYDDEDVETITPVAAGNG